MDTTLGTVYIKDYEQTVGRADLLREERELLVKVMQFYGPLPYREYGHPRGGDGNPNIYDLAHERVAQIDKLIGKE